MYEGSPKHSMFPLDSIKYVECVPATHLLFLSIVQITMTRRSMETQWKCCPSDFFCIRTAHVGRSSLGRSNGSWCLSQAYLDIKGGRWCRARKNSWLWNGKEFAFQSFRNRKKKHLERWGDRSRRILFPIFVNVFIDAVKHHYQKHVGNERV